MSIVIFLPNSDHCRQRTVYSFVNSNFKDFDVCHADFIQSFEDFLYKCWNTFKQTKWTMINRRGILL